MTHRVNKILPPKQNKLITADIGLCGSSTGRDDVGTSPVDLLPYGSVSVVADMGDREQTRTPEYMIHDQLPASPVMETVTRRKRKLGRTGSFKMLRRKSEELLSRVRLRASMDSRKGRHSVAGHYTAPCGPGGSPGRSPFVLSSDDDNSPALSRNSSLRSESGLGFSPASSRGSFLDHIGITEVGA